MSEGIAPRLLFDTLRGISDATQEMRRENPYRSIPMGPQDHQWEEAKFLVQVPPKHRPRIVEGLIFGPSATEFEEHAGWKYGPIGIMHRPEKILGYYVFHVPSARPVTTLSTLEKAQRFGQEVFLYFPINWNALNAGIDAHRHGLFLLALHIEDGKPLQGPDFPYTM